MLHASKRGIEEFVETVLRVPIALGTVSNLEQEGSAALATAHAEARQAVQEAPAKNVDETGWKQAGAKRWLWGAAPAAKGTLAKVPLATHPRQSLPRLWQGYMSAAACS